MQYAKRRIDVVPAKAGIHGSMLAIRSAAVQVPWLQRSCAPTFRQGTCTASLRLARDLMGRDHNVVSWVRRYLRGLGEPPGLRAGGNSPVEGSAALIPKTIHGHGNRIAAHPWAAPALPSRSRAASPIPDRPTTSTTPKAQHRHPCESRDPERSRAIPAFAGMTERAGTTARASLSMAVAMTLAGPALAGLDGALSIRGIALHPPWKGRDGLRAGPRVSRVCDACSDCIDNCIQALRDPSAEVARRASYA